MPSMTITTTAENAADFAAAVGWATGLSGSADAAQCKAWTIAQMKALDKQHKDHLNDLAKPAVVPIEPT